MIITIRNNHNSKVYVSFIIFTNMHYMSQILQTNTANLSIFHFYLALDRGVICQKSLRVWKWHVTVITSSQSYDFSPGLLLSLVASCLLDILYTTFYLFHHFLNSRLHHLNALCKPIHQIFVWNTFQQFFTFLDGRYFVNSGNQCDQVNCWPLTSTLY